MFRKTPAKFCFLQVKLPESYRSYFCGSVCASIGNGKNAAKLQNGTIQRDTPDTNLSIVA